MSRAHPLFARETVLDAAVSATRWPGRCICASCFFGIVHGVGLFQQNWIYPVAGVGNAHKLGLFSQNARGRPTGPDVLAPAAAPPGPAQMLVQRCCRHGWRHRAGLCLRAGGEEPRGERGGGKDDESSRNDANPAAVMTAAR